ncbi:MAG TPA: NADH-quinone oxidoreductase subunit NuoE [Syntrophorhabdaceae bacterium]|nr:NADH-quinone oxidoreductase subunit NuoE [Syntrophorhabdaceae bacterium]
MLTDKEIGEIQTVLSKIGEPRSHSVEALKMLQQRRGFISDEAIRDLAALLGMTPDELDAIATFYPFIFRKPVGRHVIYICDNVTCWIMGYESILDHITKRLGVTLGETTLDHNFTVLPVSCIGACDHAPALMIDDELYGDLTPAKIDSILERYS